MASPLNIPRAGQLPAGACEAITDVPGVRVGHCTLAGGACQTGVTVVVPHGGNLFQDKVPAAATILNGFGKSLGLVQVQELGVLETPIALTNTFSVGTVAQAQIRQAIAANPAIGREEPTLNPLVLECNDGYLNDIQAMVVEERHYLAAFEAASVQVDQGAVGAGRGMSCFGFKGGIGTSSRLARLGDGRVFTVGCLVLANFGVPGMLTAAGRHVDLCPPEAVSEPVTESQAEKGSIIMVMATDAPLDARQLRRLSLRAGAGLARTGSFFGHGSGDISLAFSTAFTIPQKADRPMPALPVLHETSLNPLFRAAAEGTEQAILNVLWHAETVTGRDGHRRLGLRGQLPPDI